jgi:hypothetical protein
MAKRNGNTPPTLAELQAQRGELAARLGATNGQLARLDPVNDWELCSRALGEQQALERALGALDERIEAMALAEQTAQRDALDVARSERAAAARARMDETARAYVDGLLALPLAEVAQARQELAAVAGWPSSAAGVPLDIARYIDGSLQRLRMIAPTWLGLPERDVRAEQIAEAQDALKRATARLAELQALFNKQRYDAAGSAPVSYERLESATLDVESCKRRLAEVA